MNPPLRNRPTTSKNVQIEFNHPTMGIIKTAVVTLNPLGQNAEAAECDLLRRELGLEDTYQLYVVDGTLYCCEDGDVPADIGRLLPEAADV